MHTYIMYAYFNPHMARNKQRQCVKTNVNFDIAKKERKRKWNGA